MSKNDWDNVLFEDKLDGLCQKCGKYTATGGHWQEDYITYQIGGWLRGIFYCEACLEQLLGPLPEPVCPIDAMAENYNPF